MIQLPHHPPREKLNLSPSPETPPGIKEALHPMRDYERMSLELPSRLGFFLETSTDPTTLSPCFPVTRTSHSHAEVSEGIPISGRMPMIRSPEELRAQITSDELPVPLDEPLGEIPQ